MTSRQIVYDALEMRSPARAPRQLWTLPWCEIHHPGAVAAIERDFPPDIVGTPGFLRVSPATKGDMYALGESTDEWGCAFENRQAGLIGEVKRPLIADEDWRDADKAHFPTEWLTLDADKVNAYCAQRRDKFLMAGFCARPFERLQFLRGTEQLYVDLMERPEGLERFIARMHELYCQVLEKWAHTDVDALMFMDDWGSQNNLLIPPRVWRALFKPLYRDYIDIAHRHGKKIFMHSDGHTLAIFPDLIEMGLDAINSQIFCMGLENLAPYKGKITFWGEIDRQHILPGGTTEDVRQAVRRVKTLLWNDGGCIAQCEFGAGARPENVRAMFEAWDELTSI